MPFHLLIIMDLPWKVTVPADFNDFSRAVRRKLVLEIANMAPPHAHGIMTVQAGPPARIGSPCNIGEAMWSDRDGF